MGWRIGSVQERSGRVNIRSFARRFNRVAIQIFEHLISKMADEFARSAGPPRIDGPLR